MKKVAAEALRDTDFAHARQEFMLAAVRRVVHEEVAGARLAAR